MSTISPISYKRHRYPAAIISQCVWLYFRFALSFRDVELMVAQRGVVFSYESIRSWCEKFGCQYARKIRRQRGRMGDVWLLDEGITDGQIADPVGKMKRGHTLKHVTRNHWLLNLGSNQGPTN